ncbi:ECF subfamily RNA polymerase sigma factor [Hyphomonas johnsonii MHS-2]|uniref:ECF subfamily RNA polymerase sigma factor n=2 Tax=Hyphomonas johnsonii TaxID=81031 RepID=A0A059FT26_9PROT|nr:ECF subfamily RNA polymerase sigma factor [Hyphomonas johnsonii MHS-2]
MRTDPDLAADAARGSDTAFAELVRRHQARVRGMSRRLTGSASDGDDIAQATFLTAWQKIATYAGGTFSAWICMICYREFLQVRRRQRPEIELDETAEIIPFDRSVPDAGDKLDLSRALAKLPEAQRICVTLCVAAGLSHREAAEATGWPLGTIKSHVNRGVAALRKHLAADQVA